MARTNRKQQIFPSRVQVLHAYNRCARQGQFFGVDPETGKDSSHRRVWVRDRLQHLAGIFSVEVLTYAILSTHVHQVLRSRPDLALEWDAETVARKWLEITPRIDRKTGEPKEPTEKEVKRIADDPKRVEKLRRRLSDVSWWMRYFSQYISVRANREDGCRGHFWAERFQSKLLLDCASVLRCMLYVDLNWVRAGMADSIQESDFTGAKDRLDDLRVAVAIEDNGFLQLRLGLGEEASQWERLEHPCSGWLSPIELDGTPLGLLTNEEVVPLSNAEQPNHSTDSSGGLQRDVQGNDNGAVSTTSSPGCLSAIAAQDTSRHSIHKVSYRDSSRLMNSDVDATDRATSSANSAAVRNGLNSGNSQIRKRRASNKGALPMSLAKYLMILEVLGRHPRPGGSATISSEIEPLCSELGIQPDTLIESVLIFDKRYDLPNMQGKRAQKPAVHASVSVTSERLDALALSQSLGARQTADQTLQVP